MIEAIGGLSAAFGLAGSAGLNAYIPLLLVALAARFPLADPFLKLSDPYQMIGSWWAIGLLVVLLVIEMTVDKIPAVDTLNDTIQTFIRPAAGALLFAANANVVTEIHPAIAVLAGIVVAGGVHATKGVTRPFVTASTAGTGNWLVSLLEDIIAFFVSLLSLLLPFLAAVVVIVLLYVSVRWYRRRRNKRSVVYQ